MPRARSATGRRGTARLEANTRTDLLHRNLLGVTERIHDAATRAGRVADDVRLVAVTKSVDRGITQRLIELGATDLGENRVQDAADKIAELPAGPTWHLIGHLQSNKARRAVRMFSWIHAVDSSPLLEQLDRVAREEGRRPRVLLQVNVSGEATKHGVTEEELPELVERAAAARGLEVAGLMTMAPLGAAPEAARPVFRRLRELRDAIRSDGVLGPPFQHLSMGMSEDFEVAVEEGATWVRVGSALFAGVPPRMEG